MSIIEDIEYDHETIKEMTVKELTYQLLCLRHLDRPQREARLKAKEYYLEVVAQTEEYLKGLDALGVTQLHDVLHDGLANYQNQVAASGVIS